MNQVPTWCPCCTGPADNITMDTTFAPFDTYVYWRCRRCGFVQGAIADTGRNDRNREECTRVWEKNRDKLPNEGEIR